MTTTGRPTDGGGDALAAPARLARLISRLRGLGRVLVLEGGRELPLPLDRPGVERRALSGVDSAGGAALEPRRWDAIVVACDRPPGGWQPLLAALRAALAEGGRLHLVLPLERGARTSAAVADAVGALYEAGYCILREEAPATAARVELPPGERSEEPLANDAALLEARPDEYLVRSYREGDEEAIQRLFDVSFSPRRDPAHWRWKYRDNPFGRLAISCAFTPQGELAAHYAAYPVPFRRAGRGEAGHGEARSDGGETILCHQVGDTMTDRRFRNVGRGPTSLLARTARHFYARHCEGRVAFNYGFNTGNIQRFSQLFVGANKVWDIELWRCPVEALRLAARRRWRPYRASRAERLDAAFDELFERVAADYGLLVERRRPWLEWRYLRCPDREIHLVRVDRGGRLVGWGVFRLEGERVLWGDALVERSHPEAVGAMLRYALEIGTGSSASGAAKRIEAWFSRHPAWWIELIGALGFVGVPEPQSLGMVYVPFREDPGDELATRYYLAMGDGDLF